jgi:hypothetical protein
MIDTTTKQFKDADMEEEKQPEMKHRHSIGDNSEMLKSETIDQEKSEISEAYEFDPFLSKTLSLDMLNPSANKAQQRFGRSESIHNPILTSFWKMNELNDQWKKIKPDQSYFKLEERGFMRHLLLEEKYDETLKHLQETFPNVIKKEEQVSLSINCLKLVAILKEDKPEEAIEFGQNWLMHKEHVKIPAIDVNGNYWEVSTLDYISLIAYSDMETSDAAFLLNEWQKEVIADMINEKIIKNLHGKHYSDLEYHMKQLDQVQQHIREHRNNLGEIFQVKAPK